MGRKILFITTDQQRYDTLGCNGGTLSRTPVADSLADLLFCVPVHQHLSEQQIAKVGEALKKVADALRR